MSSKENLYHNELRRELARILAKTLTLQFASGLIAFLAVATWLFLAVVIWTAVTGSPPLWQAVGVSRAVLVLAALAFVALVIVPLLRVPGYRRLTLEVESRKDFKDIVAAGYEFSQSDDAAERYSPALVREVIRRAVQSVAGLQVRFLFLSRRQTLLVPVAYAALLIIGILALVAPGALLSAGQRITSPTTVAKVPHDANLHATPGNITVLAGSSIDVMAVDFGGSDDAIQLSYNLSSGFWKTESTREREVVTDGGATMKVYTYTFKDIRNTLSYYFLAGNRRSATYQITVVHEPIVTELGLILTPPAYTGESADTLVDSGGNVQALEGTHVGVMARTNNTLEGAWVQFDDKDLEAVDFNGDELSFDFVALSDGSYSVHLQDSLGNKTEEPLVYGIEVYQDNPPVLDVLEPGGDASLPRNQRIGVSFVASDDYGVSKSEIYYRKAGEEGFLRTVIPLGDDKDRKDVAKQFTWDLGNVTLFPGNYIEYYVQVEDNNVVTGPGVTKSKIFHITVPTMAELYQDVQEEEATRSDLIEEALQESKELKERIEKVQREFKKNEELDWSQKKEVDKAIASQEDIRDKLEDIQKSLNETLESLSDNKMTSQEIGEKLEEINRLMEQINNEELQKYVEDLRKAMEKLDPEDIEKALENLELSTEDILESLERTESLLKEIQKEQRMEELVRKAKDLLEKQEGLQEETAETNEDNQGKMNELSEEQEQLADKADDFQKDLKDMAESLESDSKESGDPQDQEMAEMMDQAASEMSERQTSQKMTKASKQLQQSQKSQAMQNQEQAVDDMIALFTRVAQMQAQMQMQSQQRTAENLQRLAKSTLSISFKQERFTSRVREAIADEDTDIKPLSEEQQAYLNAVKQITEELDELSKQSLEVPHSLIELLGQAINDMQSSLLFLEQNKAFMSTTSAGQAVTSLNLATIELLSACQSCSQGSGGGQGSKMQQLLMGQQKLMQDSQSLMQMRALEEKLLQQRQAEIDRLAGQQRSLQEMAKEIQKDLKKNRVLGRMDKVVDEMEEVLRDLESGIIDDGTMRNEEKILSRLLDAQRSVHSRDYEKKRLSVAADDVFSEGAAAPLTERTPEALRDEIRRAMALKAPGEFEDLIKLYFRALAEDPPASRDSD